MLVVLVMTAGVGASPTAPPAFAPSPPQQGMWWDIVQRFKALEEKRAESARGAAPPAPPAWPPATCWWRSSREPVADCWELLNETSCDQSYVIDKTDGQKQQLWYTRCAWVPSGYRVATGGYYCHPIRHLQCIDTDANTLEPFVGADGPWRNILMAIPPVATLIVLVSCGLLWFVQRRNAQLAREKERLMHERTFALHALHTLSMQEAAAAQDDGGSISAATVSIASPSESCHESEGRVGGGEDLQIMLTQPASRRVMPWASPPATEMMPARPPTSESPARSKPRSPRIGRMQQALGQRGWASTWGAGSDSGSGRELLMASSTSSPEPYIRGSETTRREGTGRGTGAAALSSSTSSGRSCHPCNFADPHPAVAVARPGSIASHRAGGSSSARSIGGGSSYGTDNELSNALDGEQQPYAGPEFVGEVDANTRFHRSPPLFNQERTSKLMETLEKSGLLFPGRGHSM